MGNTQSDSSDNENSDNENSDNENSKNKNSDNENSDNENSDNKNSDYDELVDNIILEDDIEDKLSLDDFSNIKWIPDDLDISDEDLKITHELEVLLHNYFLICDKNKIININIKKYSSKTKSKYCKLLLKIHKSIKENEDMIEDVIENFPFEYNSINFSDEISNDTNDINVIDNILKIIEFYKKSKYSNTYCIYNFLSENDNPNRISIKQIFDSINKNGICLQTECNDINQEPSTDAYKKAAFRNQLKCYRVKQNINDLKDCMNKKKTFIIWN